MIIMRELTLKEQELISEKLGQEMIRLGCQTQKEFARIIGLSPGFINLILSGKRIGYRSLKKVADRLKKPVDYFLTPGTGEEPAPYVAHKVLDEDLLTHIIAKCLEVTKKLRKKLSPRQQAELYSRIYNLCHDSGEIPTEDEIKKYLWLV